jgi:hypothetical protein
LNYHHKKKEARSHKERKRSRAVSEEDDSGDEEKRPRTEEEQTAVEGASKEGETSKPEEVDEGKLWRGSNSAEPTKSRESEFQEYFDELFM